MAHDEFVGDRPLAPPMLELPDPAGAPTVPVDGATATEATQNAAGEPAQETPAETQVQEQPTALESKMDQLVGLMTQFMQKQAAPSAPPSPSTSAPVATPPAPTPTASNALEVDPDVQEGTRQAIANAKAAIQQCKAWQQANPEEQAKGDAAIRQWEAQLVNLNEMARMQKSMADMQRMTSRASEAAAAEPTFQRKARLESQVAKVLNADYLRKQFPNLGKNWSARGDAIRQQIFSGIDMDRIGEDQDFYTAVDRALATYEHALSMQASAPSPAPVPAPAAAAPSAPATPPQASPPAEAAAPPSAARTPIPVFDAGQYAGSNQQPDDAPFLSTGELIREQLKRAGHIVVPDPNDFRRN